jgi:hypothetical protein
MLGVCKIIGMKMECAQEKRGAHQQKAGYPDPAPG